jgi:hypothetical protein
MSMVTRWLFSISPKTIIRGVPCAVALYEKPEMHPVAFAKLQAAFDCIRLVAPVRYAQIVRDLRRVLVAGFPWYRGSFDSASQSCELLFTWVVDGRTSPEAVAATLVHEAQHARLRRLGFGYSPEIRPRIERLCHRAARNFARRLSEASELVDELTRQLERDPEVYSPAGRWRAKAEALESMALTGWIKVPLSGFAKWRANRSASDRVARGRPTRG